MSTKIRKKTSQKQKIRFKHKKRIRDRMEGSVEKPRFAVYRSNKFIYAQLIDDQKGHTLVSASSLEKELGPKAGKSIEGAKQVGDLIAKRAKAKSISQVVFDRGGYIYHGRVKALADAAREAGLKF